VLSAVRKLTGRKQELGDVAEISAESLNRHYAKISSDSKYQTPHQKQTVISLVISNGT
jgi:hypothetical protein